MPTIYIKDTEIKGDVTTGGHSYAPPDERGFVADANEAAASGHSKWIAVQSTSFGTSGAPGAPGAEVGDVGIGPFGDGSVRSIPPATDAVGVTEFESNLIYSGESGGGASASQPTATGHYTQMMWDSSRAADGDDLPLEDVSFNYSRPSGTDDQFDWSLGDGGARDAGETAGSFFAYDPAFAGGVSVAVSDATAGGRLYLGTDAGVFEQGVIGGDLGADDLALFEADAAVLGNTYRGMTTIEQGVIEVEHGAMMLNYHYDLG